MTDGTEDIIVIERDSELFDFLSICFSKEDTRKISINVRGPNRLAVKRNEHMWTPALNGSN